MKKLGMLGLTLGTLFVLGACGQGKTADSDTSESTTEKTAATTEKSGETAASVGSLKLGVMPANDNIPLVVAIEQGFDEKYGLDLQLENFKAAKDRDAAFQAGQVDGVSTDLVAVAIYQEAGLDVKVTGSTFGQFDLVTGDDSIQEIKDVKGQKVILSKNTGTEYAVAKMLEKGGLTEKDIEITEVPQVPSRLELLKNKQAQAAILPEPFVTMAVADGLRVLDSTIEIGVNPFVMGFESKVIDEKSEAISAMYKAYDDAVDWMNSHDKEDYIQLFIDEVGFPDTLKDQITVPEYTRAAQASEEDVTEAFSWAKEKGLLTKDLTPKDVLSDVYFK